MANKPRKRIDYAGWSTDIFSNDTKIDKLLDAQGWIGFGIYFYLCQMAFGSEGYFYEWCYDLCASTARKMGGGIGAGTVQETVGYCLQIGLFDKGLFDRWGILTSRGIQRSYLVVLKNKNRTGTKIVKEYWLLDDFEMKSYQGVVFVHKNTESLGVNHNSLGVNPDSLEVNPDSLRAEYSRVEDSRDNIIVAPPSKTKPATKIISFPDDSFEMKIVEKIIKSCLVSFPNSKVPITQEEKWKWAVEVERMKRIDHRTEKEIMQAVDFATNDNFWKTNIRSTKKLREKIETLIIQSKGKQCSRNNQFNNFQQNNYDFDDLEKYLGAN